MTTQLGAVVERLLSQTKEASLLSALATGVFTGLMIVVLSVTYAALIFTGNLSAMLSQGISMAISSLVIVGLFLALFSGSKFFLPQIDDDTAPVYALVLSLLVASFPAGLSASDLFSNVFAAIAIATAFTALVLLLFGTFRFGSFVQFLPYSVMGGYFAAVGWLLLSGAISMLSSIELSSWQNLSQLFTSENLVRWAPALTAGIAMRALNRHINKGVLLASGVALFTAAFYLFVWVKGISIDYLYQKHFLLGPFNETDRGFITPITSINWSVFEASTMLVNFGGVATIALISLLSIILCISAVSLATREDLDPNKELRINGLANLSSAVCGGMLALPSLSVSKLSYEMHSYQNRLVALIALVVATLVFFFGMKIISMMPKMVLGALLIYIGSGFVIEWLFAAYRKFGALEYSVIPIILIVSVTVGFLASIVVGVIAAIILFVIKYSRTRVVRYETSGKHLRSNLARDLEQNNVLADYGDQTRIYKLQGFLFFGTVGTLYRRVLEMIKDPANKHVRYVVLDFSQVIGVDSSATLNFEKLAQRLAERKLYLITAKLRPELLAILRRGGLDLDSNTFLSQHEELDRALEWCENDILASQATQAMTRRGIFERMADALPRSKRLHRLTHYLEKRSVKQGELLTRIGETSDEVFFLESCTASAYIIDSEQQERRVSGAGRGAIYGEIGFFLGVPRTANVKADSAGELYTLSAQSLKRMESEEPELAAAITHYLARIVTERLVNTTQSLRAVM